MSATETLRATEAAGYEFIVKGVILNVRRLNDGIPPLDPTLREAVAHHKETFLELFTPVPNAHTLPDEIWFPSLLPLTVEAGANFLDRQRTDRRHNNSKRFYVKRPITK